MIRTAIEKSRKPAPRREEGHVWRGTCRPYSHKDIWARRFVTGFGVGLALVIGPGCATQRGADEPRSGILHGPGEPVVITRASDQLSITWTTRPGDHYTIVYKEGSGVDQPWTPVPGYENFPGSGRSETIHFPTWEGDRRRFNVISVSRGRSVGSGPRIRPSER